MREELVDGMEKTNTIIINNREECYKQKHKNYQG